MDDDERRQFRSTLTIDQLRSIKLSEEIQEQNSDVRLRNQARLDWWTETRLRLEEEEAYRRSRGIRMNGSVEVDYNPFKGFEET